MSVAAQSASIDTLMAGAQKAMRAASVVADELGVAWREPHNYDAWDLVAGGIVEGFVYQAIRSSNGWTENLPLIAYDRRVSDYSRFSYVGVELAGAVRPFVCLETETDPFDSCLLANLGPELKVVGYSKQPLQACRFVAVGRTWSGHSTSTDILTW